LLEDRVLLAHRQQQFPGDAAAEADAGGGVAAGRDGEVVGATTVTWYSLAIVTPPPEIEVTAS